MFKISLGLSLISLSLIWYRYYKVNKLVKKSKNFLHFRQLAKNNCLGYTNKELKKIYIAFKK